MLWRNLFIFKDSFDFYEKIYFKNYIIAPAETFLILAQICLLLLLLSRKIKWPALILMISNVFIAEKTATLNLGPLLATPMFGVVWVNSGINLQNVKINKIILISKSTLFFFYGMLSLQALIFHLQDDFWLKGMTPGILFTSSYLCDFWQMFRQLESTSPNLFWGISKIITFLQTVFQIGMIPLLFTKNGKIFVIFWGSIFIAMSLLCLQISILPMLELILWGYLFIPNKTFENKSKV